MLAGAIATPIVSRLAELYGRGRMIVVSLLLMVAGSALLVATESFAAALAGRALQGVTAAVVPVAMSLLKDHLPADRVGSGVALMSATLGTGSAVGLPLAGMLYDGLGYHSLFWLTGVAAALLAVTVRLVVPPDPAGERERFDGAGAVLLTLGLTQALLVVTQGNAWGWGSLAIVLLGAGALVSAGLFLLWQLRVRHPLVDVRLMGRRPLLLTNLASVVIALGMLANLVLASLQFGTPVQVEGGLGLTAGETGLAMAAPAAVFVLGAPLIGRLLRRYGGRPVLLAGALGMAGSYLVRPLLDGSVAEVVAGSVLIGAASALALSAMPMIVMSLVPARQTASANGVNSLARMVGTACSTAAIAALTAATSATAGGVAYPTLTTVHVACWALAGAGAVAAVVVLLVPRDARDALPDNGSGQPIGQIQAART